MGRSRSSSSSSGGRPSSSLFGRSKPQPAAPSRPASTMAAPAPTHAPPAATRQAPVAAAAPAPAAHAPSSVSPASAAPASSAFPQAQAQSGGGLMSGLLGTVVQGMAFGTGSAVAHRAVDAIAGPRTVVHEHKGAEGVEGGATTAAAVAPAAAAVNYDEIDRTNCKNESSQFKQCINGGNLSNCQFLFDSLSQCRSTASSNKSWNY